MKSFISSFLAAAVLILASAFSGSAQTRTIEREYSPFDGVEASNGFKVSVIKNDSYSVKINVDDALESYVQCYVKSNVLYINLDDKNIPKELKKQYKGKNSEEPTLVAYVYVPVLNSLTLNDNCKFIESGTISAEKFSLKLTGSTVISNLSIVAKSAEFSVDKNAKLNSLIVKTEGDVTVNGDGKGSVILQCTSRNLTVNGGGSSKIKVNGDVENKIVVNTTGSSKTDISGRSENVTIKGKGGEVDVTGVSSEVVTASFSGASALVSPSKTLELDLGKGADLKYLGNPEIRIIKIQNASVSRK